MALPYSSGTTNGYTYAYGLAAALQQVYLYDPDFALEQDPEIYEKMLRDPVVSGAMDQLLRLVVGHSWTVEPKEGEKSTEQDRALAKVVQGLMEECYRLPSTWYNLAMASLKGCTWGRVYLEEKSLALGPDGAVREWLVVSEVRDVDKRRFRRARSTAAAAVRTDANRPRSVYAPELAEKIEAKPFEAVPSFRPEPSWRWEFHVGFDVENTSVGWWRPLEESAPRDLWLQHIVDTSERGLGYGYGLGADIYYYQLAKAKVWKSCLQGIERWGQGFLTQAVESLRDGNASGPVAAAKLQQVINVLRTHRSENVYAHDARDEVKFLDVPGAILQFVLQFLDYLDAKITARILAAVQPTGGDRGSGSYASAKVEQDSTEAAVSFLRSPLEETWTRGIHALLMRKNKANLDAMGLGGLQVPRLRLRGREITDPDQAVKVLQCAAQLRLRVREEDVYRLLSLTPPNGDDNALDFGAVADAMTQSLGALGTGGDRAGQMIGAMKNLQGQNGAKPEKDRAAVGAAGGSVADKNGAHA